MSDTFAREEIHQHKAFHEAGHAVLGIHYGRRLLRIEIKRIGVDRGQTVLSETGRVQSILESSGALSPEDEGFLRQEIKIRLGGIAAEMTEFGRHYQWPSNDLKLAGRAVRRLPSGNSASGLLAEAIADLSPLRPQLSSVAQLLLTELTPSVDRVTELAK